MPVLNELTWIDWTSLAIVAYFLIMGLFRGFLWQASRLVSLVAAYVLASVFAADFATWLEGVVSGVEGEASYYLAYFTIFVGVLVILSVITIFLDRFIKKLELSFYNHLGGGLLGVATAAALIIGILGLVYKLLPSATFVVEAKSSVTGDVSRYIVDRVGLPSEIRALYDDPSAPSANAPSKASGSGANEQKNDK